MKFPISSFKFRPSPARAAAGIVSRAKNVAAFSPAFSLVEVLITVTLLALIVLALMQVFSSTQTAFRASVTQTDVLEGSRNAMQMIADDLRGMRHADGKYLATGNFISGTVISTNPVNFFALDNAYAYCSYSGPALLYHPLPQTLPASTGVARLNLLNYFFILGSKNGKWTGVGYVVNATNEADLYPLYRFYAETNTSAPPVAMYRAFVDAVNQAQWTNMSHIMDGVVHLVARAQDVNGVWLTNGYAFGQRHLGTNTWYSPPAWGEVSGMFFGNTVPAAVELQMGVIEDRTLQRAESLPTYNARTNYLSQQAGHVHVFRQLVTVPNVDPSAYQ